MLSSLKLRETFCSTQNVLPCSYVHDYVGLMRAVCPAPSIPSSKAFVTTGDHSFIYYSHCQFKLVRQVGKLAMSNACVYLPQTQGDGWPCVLCLLKIAGQEVKIDTERRINTLHESLQALSIHLVHSTFV